MFFFEIVLGKELRERLFLDVILNNFSLWNYEEIISDLNMDIFFDLFCLAFRLCQICDRLQCTLCLDISDTIYECLCENSIFRSQFESFISDIIVRLVQKTKMTVILMMDDKCGDIVMNEMLIDIPKFSRNDQSGINENSQNITKDKEEVVLYEFNANMNELCHNFNQSELKEYFDKNVKKVQFGPKYCNILSQMTDNGNVVKCNTLMQAIKFEIQNDWEQFSQYFKNSTMFEQWCQNQLVKTETHV